MTRFSQVLAGLAAVALAGVGTLGAQETPSGQAPGAKLTPEQIIDYQLKDEKGGDPAAGRAHYEKVCASCHIFGGIGREVGPDLSAIASRFRKADLLDSIVHPSKVVSDQYRSVLVELKDGRVISGVPVRESAAVLVLRTAEAPEKPVSVPKGQIKERAASPVSLMPEGLLDGLTQQQIADLLAFLLAPPPAK